ncbi:hypothetical protein [Streptomyces sp. NPDC002692]
MTRTEEETAAWPYGDFSHCRTLGRRSRFPNVMPDVAEFLGRWNAPDVPRRDARLRRSADGNINTVGLPGIHEADDLDPAHPQWRAAIEEGVWPLVDTLTTGAWRLATYDSCQGHAYSSPSLVPGWRRVGVLPRTRGEFEATAAALCRSVRAAAPDVPAPVRVVLSSCDLSCGRSGHTYPVLDVGLDPAPGVSTEDYFASVDAATEVLTARLREQRPATGTPCGCVGGGRPARR